MKARQQQRRLFSPHDPLVEARANRVSAATALGDPFYTPAEREKRAAYYIAAAERLERGAAPEQYQ